MHLMKPIARHRAFDAMPPTIGCGWLRQLHNQLIQKINNRWCPCVSYKGNFSTTQEEIDSYKFSLTNGIQCDL